MRVGRLLAFGIWVGSGYLACASAATIPTPNKVVIVVEENRAYGQIINNSSAPYLNFLAQHGASFTDSHGVTHPSQPNYIALFSGSTHGVTDDSTPPHSLFNDPNLGSKLLAAGKTFVGYSESLPSVGFDGSSSGGGNGYWRKHNPWVNWQAPLAPNTDNDLPSSVNQPFTSFPTNFNALPSLSFVIPNQLHDMHDGTIAGGDTWLKTNLKSYADWAQNNNSLLIVTWDEDDFQAANHIPTIFYGQPVKPGNYSENIDHYDVLRTLEDMYGLPHDGGSATATTITDVFGAVNPGGPAWQNPRNRLDVDDNGTVAALDVLLLINDLNSNGARKLNPPSAPNVPPPFLDTNGDGSFSPIDALLVINSLNSNQTAVLAAAEISPVPEPSAAFLFGLALATMAFVADKSQRIARRYG